MNIQTNVPLNKRLYKLIRNRRKFMSRTKRVATQVHTRKLDRIVAHRNMENKGIRHINKDKADGSFFANNWREYVSV